MKSRPIERLRPITSIICTLQCSTTTHRPEPSLVVWARLSQGMRRELFVIPCLMPAGVVRGCLG